jgi:rRNA maturation protein Nop10
MTHSGNVYTINDKCADIRGGGEIVGGPNVVTIVDPTRFSMAGETYRHCGTKVQF